MQFLEVALIALALGSDAFAVGLGVGARFCGPRHIFRLSFHFGLFQFIMPILGWFLGQHLVGVASGWAPWIAFGLLFGIGAKMTWESLRAGAKNPEANCADPTRGLHLLFLSVATSLDALGVGLSIGILGFGLLFPAVWTGITAGFMTWASMKLGNRLSDKFGRRIEVAGGLVLMVIAVKLLF
jgi:putative Mn2+ efflux pump MntP